MNDDLKSYKESIDKWCDVRTFKFLLNRIPLSGSVVNRINN